MGLISALWHDWSTRGGRYKVLEALVRNLPGQFGYEVRRRLLSRYFQRAGTGLRLASGIRLLGVHRLAVGRDCWIGLNNVIQANGGVEIGDDVLLGPGVSIWSVNHVYSDPARPILHQGYEHKRVVIGNGAWIGANAFIMPGAHIGDGVVVSAGAVVGGKKVEPYAVLAGNPARKIGSRLPAAGVSSLG